MVQLKDYLQYRKATRFFQLVFIYLLDVVLISFWYWLWVRQKIFVYVKLTVLSNFFFLFNI